MGENLEASILCTLHLSRIGVPVIRAKAVSEDHASILRMVGASYTIFPERETARRVAAEILNPNMLDFVPLEGEYLVRDVTFPPALHGISLGQLNLRALLDVFVLAVRRQTEPRFTFLPGPGYVNVPGDVMVMIGRGADLEKIEKMTEPPPPPMPPPCNETPAP
jgi:trk system potassium uptake protein TrkA